MIALLDVNVLIALAWPNHIHHALAHAWFCRQQARGWATCPLSQSGFVRVSSNPRVFQGARTPGEALSLLRKITDLPGHHFLEDRIVLCRSPHLERVRVVGHRQVTDAHLLAIALDHDGALATFDQGISGLTKPTLRRRVMLIGRQPRT